MKRSQLYHDLAMAVQGQCDHEGITKQSALRDALTDFRHYADDENLNFDQALSGSEEVYQEEKELYHGQG